MNETNKRSIAKTISWRLAGSGATFAVAFFVSGSLTTSGSIAVLQMISNTVLYFLHERLWNQIDWGKR